MVEASFWQGREREAKGTERKRESRMGREKGVVADGEEGESGRKRKLYFVFFFNFLMVN